MKRALVLSLICVLGLGFGSLAATLSGSWDTDVCIDPQQTNFNDAISLDSIVTVKYAVCDWTFTSVTVLDETGWVDQDFNVSGVLGAFSFTSLLDFNPAVPEFGSWINTVSVSIAGVSFSVKSTLDAAGLGVVFTGTGAIGDCTVKVVATFGDATTLDCDLDWTGVDFTITFPFCCADITFTVGFDCEGFEMACFGVKGIAVPNMPYLTLAADVCFTVDEKTLDITPAFAWGDIACFDLYFEVTTAGNLSIQNITITGIGLECTIGGVDFIGVSYWGAGAKPSILAGTEYWEAYQIKTTDDGCCGAFGFDLGFFFLDTGTQLFDIALIDVNMSLQIASQFKFTMGLEIDFEVGGFTEWCVGFVVTW
jgi:hypothetical protein